MPCKPMAYEVGSVEVLGLLDASFIHVIRHSYFIIRVFTALS
jgi:hypothetical protein